MLINNSKAKSHTHTPVSRVAPVFQTHCAPPFYDICLGRLQDHYVYIFEDVAQHVGDLDLKTTALHRIKHNNHTGRWLSKFWPTWDPKEPSAFVIGSMEQPRRVEVKRLYSNATDAIKTSDVLEPM